MTVLVNTILISCANVSKFTKKNDSTHLEKWSDNSDDENYQYTIFVSGHGQHLNLVVLETISYGQNEILTWVKAYTADVTKAYLKPDNISLTNFVENIVNYCQKGIEIKQEIHFQKETDEFHVLSQFTIKKYFIYHTIALEMNKKTAVFNESVINYFSNQADQMQADETRINNLKKNENDLENLDNINSIEFIEEIKPIKPLKYVRVTSEFGRRNGRNHNGIDLSAGTDTPIFAVLSGTVVTSTFHRTHGNIIVIQHDDATQTAYAHNKQNFVTTGEEVQQGQMIGTVGRTGRTTGNHLHFEYRINGIPQNPRLLIPDF